MSIKEKIKYKFAIHKVKKEIVDIYPSLEARKYMYLLTYDNGMMVSHPITKEEYNFIKVVCKLRIKDESKRKNKNITL